MKFLVGVTPPSIYHVYLPYKLSPQFTCALTIGRLIFCVNIHSLGSDILEISKRRRLELMRSGVYNKKKAREEDEHNVPSKENNSEGGSNCVKVAL